MNSVITSGGGFSSSYPLPSFQRDAVAAYFIAAAAANHTPVTGYGNGRGYPDLTLSGVYYRIIVGGQWHLVAGTSATSPALAGMFSSINAARHNAGKGSIGWINPVLYSRGSAFVKDITSGKINCIWTRCCPEGFYAAKGWDPASGLGSINYGNMEEVFVSLGTASAGFIRPTSYPTRSPTSKPTATPTYLPSRTDRKSVV